MPDTPSARSEAWEAVHLQLRLLSFGFIKAELSSAKAATYPFDYGIVLNMLLFDDCEHVLPSIVHPRLRVGSSRIAAAWKLHRLGDCRGWRIAADFLESC